MDTNQYGDFQICISAPLNWGLELACSSDSFSSSNMEKQLTHSLYQTFKFSLIGTNDKLVIQSKLNIFIVASFLTLQLNKKELPFL